MRVHHNGILQVYTSYPGDDDPQAPSLAGKFKSEQTQYKEYI